MPCASDSFQDIAEKGLLASTYTVTVVFNGLHARRDPLDPSTDPTEEPLEQEREPRVAWTFDNVGQFDTEQTPQLEGSQRLTGKRLIRRSRLHQDCRDPVKKHSSMTVH